MKMFAYLILAVVVAALLLQPLCEVLLVCKDTLTVNSAANNAVRAAKKESYLYEYMKDGKTAIDEEAFKTEFVNIFAVPMNLTVSNTEHLTSADGRYNDFYVRYDFDTVHDGDRVRIDVTVSVESEYKFKTKLLRQAERLIRNTSGIFKLTHERKHNLILIN